MDAILQGKKILVIGASSFIGTNLIQQLITLGANVSGTVYKSKSYEWQIPIFELDITRLNSVSTLLKKIQPEIIFNVSGHVNGSRAIEQLWPTFRINLEGTLNLLTALQETPCERLVITASLDEFQRNPSLLQPVSPYAASKMAANAYARMFHTLYNLPVVIVQPFIAYGIQQKDQQKLLPYTILSLLKGEIPQFTSGARLADWIYISDVVNGFIAAASCKGIEGQTLQLGLGESHSVKEVVSIIFQYLKIPSVPHFNAMADRPFETEVVADISKTYQQVRWKPEVSFQEGIHKTVDWYKDQFEKGLL